MAELITKTVRFLRHNATPAESKFWQIVRNRKIDGFRFYRQHPIEFVMDGCKRFFVADFYCKQQKPIVEIDGGIHERQKEYDKFRTYIVGQLGMRVVRFTNEEVTCKIENVIERLKSDLTP